VTDILTAWTDGNTRHALSRLPDLVDALPDDARELAVEPSVTVGMWHRGALLLLGAERRWAHIRVTDDDGNPLIATCPYCQDAVRIRPDLADLGDPHRATGHDCDVLGCTQRGPDAIRGDQHAEAECVNQECRDDNGYRRTCRRPMPGQRCAWVVLLCLGGHSDHARIPSCPVRRMPVRSVRDVHPARLPRRLMPCHAPSMVAL
jgi:hypothetical protein